MKKNIKELFSVVSIFKVFKRLSSDDNISQDSKYPITLSFKGIDSDEYLLYKDGKESKLTKKEVVSFLKDADLEIWNDAASVIDYDKDLYFKFLNDTELETILGDDNRPVKVSYKFIDSYLYQIKPNGDRFLLAQGDKEKLIYRYGEYNYRKIDTNGMLLSKGASDSFEDEDYQDDFHYSFSNINISEFDSVESIQGNDYLIIHNIASKFERLNY